MRSKLIVGFVMLTVSAAGVLGLRGASRAVAGNPCARRGGPPLGVAIDNGTLTDGRGAATAVADRSAGYQLRGVAAAGDAVAYVRDLSGPDQLVLAESGAAALDPTNEAACVPFTPSKSG